MAKKKHLYSRLRKKMPPGTRIYKNKKKATNKTLGRKKIDFKGEQDGSL